MNAELFLPQNNIVMKKIPIVSCISILMSVVCDAQPVPGSMVPGIAFTYDGAGRRIVREPGTVCFGCKPGRTDSAIKGTPVLSDNGKISIFAYPNPTEGVLFINNLNWQATDKAEVEVLDMAGRSVLKKQFNQAKDAIWFEKYASGVYMVYYFLNTTTVQVWKVVKK